MTPKLRPATFRIDEQLLEGLERVRERDGVGISEQVRRAIAAWLTKKDAPPRRKRARSR